MATSVDPSAWDFYGELVDAFGDPEALTLLVVAGASRESVARALDVDLHAPVGHPWDDKHDPRDVGHGAWALVEVDGGVLGVEHSGYGDPSAAALREMSRGGAAAAVIRGNVEASLRFGCARDDRLVFDVPGIHEAHDAADVPDELQPLLDVVGSADAPGDFVVGLAMAEAVTGLELTTEQALLVAAAQFFKSPRPPY